MLFRSLQPRFWASLGLSIFFSFAIPIVVLTSLWGVLFTLAQCPWTQPLGGLGLPAFVSFLATFGTGNPWLGILVISGVAAIAGALFDAYAFSQSRSWHSF